MAAPEDFMSFDHLDLLRKSHASWKLLASDDAAFCSAFFYREFIENNRRNLPEEVLVRDLKGALYARYGEAAPPDRELEMEARGDLKTWASDDRRWLRRFYRNHTTCYDLTTAAQKAVEWLLGLRERSFVGTESRLHLFFHLLHEIENEANPDKEARKRHLLAKRKAIDAEIKALNAGGEVQVLSDVQIKERFLEAMKIGESILSDFREVKDQFQTIYETFRREVNEWEEGKGGLLARFLENRDLIERSDQGKSFSAFFDYLMAPDAQQDFDRTAAAVLAMGHLSGIAKASEVRHIKRDWIEGAEDVQQTVGKLSDQISWYVNEKNLEEKRNIYFLVRDISRKAQEIRGQFPRDKSFMTVDEGAPHVELPMDRTCSLPPVELDLRTGTLALGTQQGSAAALFSQVHVDKQALIRQIEALLKEREEVTLAEVVERYPMKAGLLEMLTYLEAAKECRGKTMPGTWDLIPYTGLDGARRAIRAERIVFHRKPS